MLCSAKWLDPRESPPFPIAGSVHIPLSQLAERAYELPRRHAVIAVADTGDEAKAAADWLRINGREVTLGSDFEIGEPGTCRLWAPNRFLEYVLPNLANGSAIDLACGGGRESVHLADRGFTVTAVDLLPDALEIGRKLESRYLQNEGSVEWRQQDLEKGFPDGQFDLAICFLFMNRDLLRHIPKMLRPGGAFVFETFTTINRETLGKPRREAFAIKHGELRDLMPELEVRTYEEDWHEGRHTARYWGMKP